MKVLNAKNLKHRRLWIAGLGALTLASTVSPDLVAPIMSMLETMGMELGTVTGSATGILALDSLLRPKKDK